MGELQGRTFGGYQLVEEIGSGGIAEVYRARQAAGGGRDVVVKVIYKEFARQPGFAHNIAYVTEASARLASHPHILPLVAHGEENEYLYLVTPYVEAGTLADWINKGGRLGVADVAPFFQQLCGALSYAHSLGVVHGNLKPSNIFLHEGRHILLGDFGLLWDVRALDTTWSGSGVEAFEYLAPEVFSGQITQAGDIYSLGATLFHALSGHTPFHKDKLADLITAAQLLPPPSLGQQQPPVAPAIAALDPVVAQAMAKRPDDRYPAAGQLGQAIDTTVRQAAQGGFGISQPNAQPQWQAMASTPLSAGVFDAPGQQQIAPVFGAPPIAPGALAGMLGTEIDSSMEAGGAALAGGMASSVPGLAPQSLEPPTMRVPAPTLEPPTMRIAAPQLDPLGTDSGITGLNGQPITAPRIRNALAPGGTLDGSSDQSTDDRYAASGLMPLDPPDALLDASIKRISQRLPAVQGEADAAQSGTFSPTSLGLPRLTNPALKGKLPQEWQDLLTDESARRRHDPFATSREAELNPAASDSAINGGAGAAMGSQPGANRRQNNWAASDPARPWETSSDQSASGAAGGLDAFAASSGMATPKHARKADYEIENLAPSSHSRSLEDDFNDPMHEQKVWTNSYSIVRLRQRVSVGTLVIFLLVVMALVELAGFAVARPDLCVTHACAMVSGEVQKLAPNLQIPGAPAPVSFGQTPLKISAITNGSGATTATLTNTGSRPVTWKASTTLGWLSVSPATGALAKGAHATLTLTAQPDGVAPGSYSAGLVVEAATGQSATPVALTVLPGPALSVTTPKLSFNACGVTQTLTIANTGGAKLSYTASPSQSDALNVSPSSGAIDPGKKATLSVTLYCSASAGQSYAVILVSDGGSAQTPVTYGS